MKRLTTTEKKESLTVALRNLILPAECMIVNADGRLGSRFAIAVPSASGGISVKTGYMSYEEMNSFIFGYYKGLTKSLSL